MAIRVRYRKFEVEISIGLSHLKRFASFEVK